MAGFPGMARRLRGLLLLFAVLLVGCDHATKLAAHFFDRGAHVTHIFFLRKIHKRLILKRAFVQADLQTRLGFQGCHNFTSRDIQYPKPTPNLLF